MDLVKFDYDGLAIEDREFVRQKETAIKARTAQTIIENGRDLMEVKDRLEHGQFEDWCKANFPWGKTTVTKMMNVASECSQYEHLDFSKSVLYLLAENSTPESARQEAVKKAESGEKITYAEAKKLKEAHMLIHAHEGKIRGMEEMVKDLKSQIPTDDVKSEISRLKSDLYDAQNKPPVVETPEDYEDLKNEKSALKFQLKSKQDSIDGLIEKQSKAIKNGIETEKRKLKEEFDTKQRQIESIEKRIVFLRKSADKWETRTSDLAHVQESAEKIKQAIMTIGMEMNDIFEDCIIPDEMMPTLKSLARNMKDGATLFENTLNETKTIGVING